MKVFEEEIVRDQLKNIDNDGKIGKILKEYEERKSIEAILAKDADRIDQILLEKEYAHTGNNEAKRWMRSRSQFSRLKSPEAKKLAKLVYKQRAGSWWWDDWTSERR